MCVQNEEQKKVKGTKSTGAMELEIQTQAVDLRPGHPTWAKRGQWKIEIEITWNQHVVLVRISNSKHQRI